MSFSRNSLYTSGGGGVASRVSILGSLDLKGKNHGVVKYREALGQNSLAIEEVKSRSGGLNFLD